MDLNTIQLMILACVYFFGVFSCRYASRLFEISHAARLVEKAVYRSLLICSVIHEDVVFLKEIKLKQLKEAGYEKNQIKKFMEMDEQITSNWKESVVQNILINSPREFSFATKFTNWKEAMSQLNEMHRRKKG